MHVAQKWPRFWENDMHKNQGEKKRNARYAFRLAVREDAWISHRPDGRGGVLPAQIVLADICVAM
jgi:hypothetical protein